MNCANCGNPDLETPSGLCAECLEDAEEECSECGTALAKAGLCADCAKDEELGETFVESALKSLLEERLEEELLEYGICDGARSEATTVRVSTFKEQELLTRDRGLVLRIGRREFQLSIVKSK
jgi:hypothetical protein